MVRRAQVSRTCAAFETAAQGAVADAVPTIRPTDSLPRQVRRRARGPKPRWASVTLLVGASPHDRRRQPNRGRSAALPACAAPSCKTGRVDALVHRTAGVGRALRKKKAGSDALMREGKGPAVLIESIIPGCQVLRHRFKVPTP